MLLDAYKKDLPFCPYINTGTMFDLYTGRFVQGINDTWILDGGLSQCVGISGRGQTYKSGLAGSLMARAMVVHPTAEAIVYESEGTVAGPERYDDFTSALGVTVSPRILFQNSTISNLSDFYDEFYKITADKEKHKKDYIVESPFINNLTGKPYKVWIPTFLLIDSFSRARSSKGDKQFEDNSIDESAMNTFWLTEGNVKSKIMNDLPGRAAKCGVYAILTAHVGDKQELNPMVHTPKQLQFMKNSDKMKNVGSNFEFLTTTLIQTLKSEVLQTDKKTCEYPASFSTDVEVNQVTTMMVRCKNNASGIQFPFIVSQYQGILDAVTNFHFLRKNKYWGLDIRGNNQEFATTVDPDQYFKRTNLREVATNDYKVRRGLEIIAQLCFVQTLWSTWKLPPYINMNPIELGERLNSNKEYAQRVLESTGVWSTAVQERERMTLLDILKFVDEQCPKKTVSIPAETKSK